MHHRSMKTAFFIRSLHNSIIAELTTFNISSFVSVVGQAGLSMTWLRGYIAFFMLNLTEHELSANNKFLALSLSDVVFIMLIYVNFRIYEQDTFHAQLS